MSNHIMGIARSSREGDRRDRQTDQDQPSQGPDLKGPSICKGLRLHYIPDTTRLGLP